MYRNSLMFKFHITCVNLFSADKFKLHQGLTVSLTDVSTTRTFPLILESRTRIKRYFMLKLWKLSSNKTSIVALYSVSRQ